MKFFCYSAPGDYMPGQYTVVIPAGDTEALLILMTNDDDIAELTEKFTVTIIDTCDLASPGNPSTGYVHILDDDSECMSWLTRNSFHFNSLFPLVSNFL